MRVIHSGKFQCDLCKQERRFNVLGHEEVKDRAFEEDALRFARHDHWTRVHRVCAVCGKLVDGEELELAVNDGTIPIHKDYTHDYGTKVEPGDISFCLIVHKRCVQ